MVVTRTLWEETCLVCLPTAMQTARGDQHHLQPGNNHSNGEMKPFAFISQPRLQMPVTPALPTAAPKTRGWTTLCWALPAAHSSRGTCTLCSSSLFRWEKVQGRQTAPGSTAWPWATLTGRREKFWRLQRWDGGNFCEGEQKQATAWRCGTMKQRLM